jgi:hypothetical protein
MSSGYEAVIQQRRHPIAPVFLHSGVDDVAGDKKSDPSQQNAGR